MSCFCFKSEHLKSICFDQRSGKNIKPFTSGKGLYENFPKRIHWQFKEK